MMNNSIKIIITKDNTMKINLNIKINDNTISRDSVHVWFSGITIAILVSQNYQ